MTAAVVGALELLAFLLLGPVVMPVLGALVGVIALVVLRRGGRRGRGLAIAAITCTALPLAFSLFVTVGPAPDGMKEWARERVFGNVTTEGHAPGDCLRLHGENGADINAVETVPCDTPHDAEVIAIIRMEAGPWPGATEVEVTAARECREAEAVRRADLPEGEKYANFLWYYVPSERGWNTMNHHEIACVHWDPEVWPRW
ncbi:hypothetical protein FNX48_023585 [Streptomyces sp. IF17]|nr:hypothetical protein [Streptomyces alkaliphilus]